MKWFQSKFAAVAYLAGILIIHGTVLWNARDLVRKGYPDFTIYYCAGTMVRQGLGHDLYDLYAQYHVQRTFAPEVATRLAALPYNHPPFEALIFVPFSLFPYFTAFVLWGMVNFSLLLVSLFLLRTYLAEMQIFSWELWLLGSLAFFPIFFNLLQGQDSILLLFLYAVALVCLKTNRDALAGGSLALGLFKPHLVLPFVLLWLVSGHKRLLRGFLPTAAGLIGVSVVVVGWAGFAAYPRYVVQLEETMARGAIMPSDMPNVRGIVYVLFHGSSLAAPIAIAISIGIFLLTAWQCRQFTADLFRLRFVLAVVATVLVSYHCLGYDLSILALPVALITAELQANSFVGSARPITIAALALLFFSPLQLFLLMRGNHLAIIGWAVALLMAGISMQAAYRPQQLPAAAKAL